MTSMTVSGTAAQPDEITRAASAAFDDAHAVIVSGRTIRRHLYFNLPAAERAVKRARARGDDAAMVLVRLVPVAGGETR